MDNKFILDACCGGRMMWINKNHPNALYIDIRRASYGHIKQQKHHIVDPDLIMDFRHLEFGDKSFKLVVFDPPHLSTLSETSLLRKKFGCLNAETWQGDLKGGFKECWRVLDDYGVLIFKWNNQEISFKRILKMFLPIQPLFGQIGISKGAINTKWFCFMKIPKKQVGKNDRP